MKSSILMIAVLMATATLMVPFVHAGDAAVEISRNKETGSGSTGNLLDDGPHVYWRDDTTAVVIYYRGGELLWESFSDADTVRFQGFGGFDDSTEYIIPTAGPSPGPCRFEDVPVFLALSDIHGDYRHFREILLSCGVMDSTGCWAWGDGHLVINGDVFDRGPRVTECLWLIYRLQQQAPSSGGEVHLTLGNHELMVLRGDLRYVSDRYVKGVAGHTGIDYDELFGPETELGRWLRSQPSAVRLDDVLFVHAGIAPAGVAEHFSMEDMNSLILGGLDHSSLQVKFDDVLRSLYGGYGPLWYRGFHYGMEGYYSMATADEIDEILDFYDVERIVVGHTEVDSLSLLYGGRVIAIDVPVDELGGQQALLHEGGTFYRVGAHGGRRRLPVP